MRARYVLCCKNNSYETSRVRAIIAEGMFVRKKCVLFGVKKERSNL